MTITYRGLTAGDYEFCVRVHHLSTAACSASQQCAVLSAAGAINAIARTQIVERVVSVGMFAPRQHQRVNQPLGRNRRLARALQLGSRRTI
jgi:hypothetical protein